MLIDRLSLLPLNQGGNADFVLNFEDILDLKEVNLMSVEEVWLRGLVYRLVYRNEDWNPFVFLLLHLSVIFFFLYDFLESLRQIFAQLVTNKLGFLLFSLRT